MSNVTDEIAALAQAMTDAELISTLNRMEDSDNLTPISEGRHRRDRKAQSRHLILADSNALCSQSVHARNKQCRRHPHGHCTAVQHFPWMLYR